MIATATQDKREMLRDALPDNYHQESLELLVSANTRDIFVVEWGPGQEKRVVKVDTTAKSPRAKRHLDRGYNTQNDLEVLARIRDPEENHLSGLVDYGRLETGETYSVERFFEGSSTLKERVQRKPLSAAQASKVFTQITHASKYLIREAGVFNRDLNAGNILIRDHDLETRITDLANACSTAHEGSTEWPTSGSRHITDPLTMGPFVETARRYGEQQEIYSIAANLFYALTGTYFADIDPDNVTASAGMPKQRRKEAVARRTDVLSQDNTIHIKLYEKELRRATRSAPRQFKNILRRGLSIDERKRYATIEAFEMDLTEAAEATLNHDRRTNARGIAVTAAFMLGFSAYTIGLANQEAPLWQVETSIDSDGFSVDNNTFEMDFSASGRTNWQEHQNTDKSVVYAEPGERIMFMVNLREGPGIPKDALSNLPHFPSRIYMEGDSAHESALRPRSYDGSFESAMDFPVMPWWSDHATITAPEKPGIYWVHAESAAPAPDDSSAWRYVKERTIGLPDNSILSRRSIALVVGDIPDDLQAGLRMIRGSYWKTHFTFRQIPEYRMESLRPGIEYVVEIPGLDADSSTVEEIRSNAHYLGMPLPQDSISTMVRIGKASIVLDGDTIGHQYFSIRPDENELHHNWSAAVPPVDMAERIQKIRSGQHTDQWTVRLVQPPDSAKHKVDGYDVLRIRP